MPEKKAQKIADAAEVIVNGYAMGKHKNGVRIVNLDTGHVVVASVEGVVIVSDMDPIEEKIAIEHFIRNRQFMPTLSHA